MHGLNKIHGSLNENYLSAVVLVLNFMADSSIYNYISNYIILKKKIRLWKSKKSNWRFTTCGRQGRCSAGIAYVDLPTYNMHLTPSKRLRTITEIFNLSKIGWLVFH